MSSRLLLMNSPSLHPLGHQSNSMWLKNRANCLVSSRYKQLGKINDLNGTRDTLSLCLLGSSMALNRACHLVPQHCRGTDDLDEAIVPAQEALLLLPPVHLDCSVYLSNLVNCLVRKLGGIDNLNKAFVLGGDTISLDLPEHPDRSMSLDGPASCLGSRFCQLGGINDDLNEAIALTPGSLLFCTPEHPDRSMSLDDLEDYRASWHSPLPGLIDNLNETVILTRRALLLSPGRPTPLNNFSSCPVPRYRKTEEIYDSNEIVLARDALGHCYQRCSRGTDDLNEAVVLSHANTFSTGHSDQSVHLQDLAHFHPVRFTNLAQVEDREGLFNFYAELQHVSQTVSSTDLSTAKAWIIAAEAFHHPTTLLAYETALRLLTEHLTTLPVLPQQHTVFKSLSSSLAVDAFSACLRNQSLTQAVEFLEQGRGVFWNQLARLRSPLDDVIASGPAGEVLADEFNHLTSHIHTALHSPGADQHDQVCRLNLELQKVVFRIRELPNLSRFLLPAPFSDLRRAASEGPIIIVNASQYGCDALIVSANEDPVHVPLSVTRERVQTLVSKLRVLIGLAKTEEPREIERRFMCFLRVLWDEVVSYIIDSLRVICPLQSRIWWCPTAEFSLLPLHAAAPYRRGEMGVPQLFISSYTTTLSALIRARRTNSLGPTTRRRFAAIGQAQAPGSNELLCVSTELTNIGQLVDDLTTFTRIEGEDACISNVADELHKNEWVHFACHGIPNQQRPFESAFALHDGRFTIQHITQCKLENPEFAYLSACHTTVGDQESPDEMIHLAAAMECAGFRSVIGTMWALDDAQTNKVTSLFYKHMIDESGHLDYTRAAFALRNTMGSLVDIPIDQRILYVHFGA